MKGLTSKHGFTLAELLVATALFLIVIAIGYGFYSYLTNTYQKTESRWIEQREVRKVADFLNSELKNTFTLTISSNIPASGVKDEYDLYLQDGRIMFIDGTDTPVTLGEGNLTLQFSKAMDVNGNDLYNVLAYTLSAPEINYSVDSAVLLSNMTEAESISGTASGTSIHFRTVEDISSIPSSDLGSFCFIATAAYGTNTEPYVMLLRQFRDEVLLQSAPGRSFVDFYYRHSPAAAKVIAGSIPLRLLVMILLTPVVGVAVILMYKEAALLFLLFIAVRISCDRRKRYRLS